MAGLDMKIQYETRLCEVDGKVGYFHTWEQWSKIVSPSIMVGGHPGGTVSKIFGIVELEDEVKRVDPTEIKFCDESNDILKDFNEMRRANAEN